MLCLLSAQAVKMSPPNTDYDAAQALLDLQGTMKPVNSDSYLWRSADKEDMEKTAKLFWNCFISSEVSTVPNINHREPQTKTATTANPDYAKNPLLEHFNKNIKTETMYKENIPEYYLQYNRKNSKARGGITNKSKKLSRLEQKSCKETKYLNDITNVTTREIGTQTEERYFSPNFELMETTIKNLYERIQSLEAQLKKSDVPAENICPAKAENMDDVSYEGQNEVDNMSFNESHVSQYSEYEDRGNLRRINEQRTDLLHLNRVLTNHNTYPNSNDLVPIGDGNASVPARLLRHINWNSYTSATRKLLTAVFSRRILATHSVTGKRSPAFPNKPAKKKLDPALVNDIVQTVVERCSVPENVVRTSITTKCADESKMFRTRQSNKKRRTGKKSRENVSPTSSESESDNF